MLEQLGLGIVLSFEDNFTPQSNNAINSMHRLESQAEQMSSNIQKSLNNLQNLMLSGFSLNEIGGSFQNAGKAITGAFAKAFESIAKASAQMETYKAQFKTVFGDKADKNMNWAVKFAVETPFELKDLISSMQKMGSQKIDVSKTFKNAKGEAKSFMEYMGDLATRNMGATGGLEGMGTAISNAWSGQFKSIRDRFDLPNSALKGLKQYAGKDLNKFMSEFTKLADKYAPDAMKNLEGTWNQTISNMEDAWFNMMFRLGDKKGGADVFGSMKKSLNKVALLLFEVSSNGKMLQSLRDIFNDLWKPVDKLVDLLVKAVKGILNFAQVHPVLTSIIVKFVAFSGIALTLVGTIMKLSGSFMIFTTSIISAYANLKILKTLNLGGELAKIASGFGFIGRAISTSTLLIGALGVAYKLNLGGFRKEVQGTIETLKQANTYKSQLLNANAVNMTQLFAKRSDGLQYQIGYLMAKFEAMKLVAKDAYNIIIKGHSDLLKEFTQNHFDPIKHFGLEKFQKGIMAVIIATKEFVIQFKNGLNIAYETTKRTLGLIFTPIVAVGKAFAQMFGGANDGTIDRLNSLKDILGEVGRVLGAVLGTLVGFKVVKGITGLLLSPFKALLRVLGRVERKTMNVFSKLKPSNWFTGRDMNKYMETMKIRSQIDRATGKGHTEQEYRAMGLGLSRSQRKAGYAYQRNMIEDATGRHFTTAQFRAMGIGKPQSLASKAFGGISSGISTLIAKIKSRAELVDTGLSNNPYSMYKPAKLDVSKPLDNGLDKTFFSAKSGYNGVDTVQVAKRPKWFDTLFGQKFYSANPDGTRNALGSYGGALTKRYDNEQMRLASQLTKPVLKQRSDFSTEEEYARYKKSVVTPHESLGITASSLNGFKDSSSLYDKVNSRLGDYIGSGKQGAGQFRVTPNMNEEQKEAIRARRQQAVMGVLNGDKDVLSQFGNRNHRKISDISGAYATSQLGDKEVFLKKQSWLSKALFGQKMYTVGQRANGTLYEHEVGRRGGIFNNRNNDGKLVDKGDTSLRGKLSSLGGALKDDYSALIAPKVAGAKAILKSRLMSLANSAVGAMKDLASTVSSKVSSSPAFQKLKVGISSFGSKLSKSFSSLASKLKELGTITSQKIGGSAFGSKMKSIGGFLGKTNTGQLFKKWSSSISQSMKNALSNIPFLGSRLPNFNLPKQGGVIGKIAGAGGKAFRGLGAVGRITGKGLGMMGRGAVGLGRGALGLGRGALGLVGGALGMIPSIAMTGMVASSAVGGIKSIGAGLSNKERSELAKKRGLKGNDTLGLGMAKISKSLSKFNFTSFWNSFKKSSKKMLPIFRDIFKDVVRIGKKAFPTLIKEVGRIAKTVVKQIPRIFAQLPKAIRGVVKFAKPLLMTIWKDFSRGLAKFISTGLPKLLNGFSKFVSWVASKGIPLIVKGLGKLATFFGNTVVPKLLELAGKFVNWFFDKGVPKILEAFKKLVVSLVSNFPSILAKLSVLLGQILLAVGKLGLQILSKLPGFLANVSSAIWGAITDVFQRIGSWLSSFFSGLLGKVIDSILPSGIGSKVKSMLGIKHHGGLYMSPDEHFAIIQEGETVLPKGKSARLDAMLEGRSYWQQNEREKRSRIKPMTFMAMPTKPQQTVQNSTPQGDTNIKIDKVEVKLNADKLSRTEARKQALMLLDEFKKIGKERDLRNSTKNRKPVVT